MDDKLEREIARLAEDGKRRRQRKEETMRREILEEEERREGGKEENEQENNNIRIVRSDTGGTAVREIDRTVKVRWVREGAGLLLDKDGLQSLFSSFGKIESAFTLKDKKQRIGGKGEKKIFATGVVVFSSIVGAHSAVEDSGKQHGDVWDIIQSVFWASNKEPDFGQPSPQSPIQRSAAASTPAAPGPAAKSKRLFEFPGRNNAAPATCDKSEETRRDSSSFSFSTAGINTSKDSSARTRVGFDPTSPSFEEITLIRLKNAQKKLEKTRQENEAAALGEAINADQ